MQRNQTFVLSLQKIMAGHETEGLWLPGLGLKLPQSSNKRIAGSGHGDRMTEKQET